MQEISGMNELFDDNPIAQNTFPVMQVRFMDGGQMTWQELFAGFDTMRAITYSSGLRFMDNVLSTFSNVEIVLGFEDVIQPNVEGIIASQKCTVEELRDMYKKDAPNITRLIDNDEIRFFVAYKQISHEKGYSCPIAKAARHALSLARQTFLRLHLAGSNGRLSLSWMTMQMALTICCINSRTSSKIAVWI